jgi:hypothetical protein
VRKAAIDTNGIVDERLRAQRLCVQENVTVVVDKHMHTIRLMPTQFDRFFRTRPKYVITA